MLLKLAQPVIPGRLLACHSPSGGTGGAAQGPNMRKNINDGNDYYMENALK